MKVDRLYCLRRFEWGLFVKSELSCGREEKSDKFDFCVLCKVSGS